MASMQLCNTTANFQKTQMNLSSMIASTTLFSSKVSNFRVQSLPQRDTHIIRNHIDKFLEPFVSSASNKPAEYSNLKIGIIGLGEFGQFLAKAFKRQGHQILATSRSDYTEYCEKHGIEFFREMDGLCEAQPDVLLVCSSILSTEDVVRGIPFHKLDSRTIIADVLSVKEHPRDLFLEVVPPEFGILCTHPMFGKYSGKNSWEGLRFVFDKVRIDENSIQGRKCAQFLNIFEDEGCRMVEMSCEEHDQYAAESQFITHTVARILDNMNLESTPINTKGYETLMELTKNTVSHGTDLYDGLFLYNVNATKQIENIDKAFDTVKQKLFGKLRLSMRRQMVDYPAIDETSEIEQTTYFLPSTETVKDLSSFSVIPEQGNKDASLEFNREVSQAAQ